MPLNDSCIPDCEQFRLRDLLTDHRCRFLRWSGKGFVAAVQRGHLDEVKAAASNHRMTVSDTRLAPYTPGPDDDLFSGFFHSADGRDPSRDEPIYLLEAQVDFIPPTHVLALNTWGGTRYYAVEVVGPTAARIRIQVLQDVTLPGKRELRFGDTVLVPMHAVLPSAGRHLQQLPYELHVYGYGYSGVDADRNAARVPC